MSLMDLLLSEPSAMDKALGIIGMMESGGSDPRPSGSGYGSVTPSGRGIFFNDDVDVLQAGDPRLMSGLGVTMARPAMRSLREISRELGIRGDWGGGYRTASEQQAMLDRGAPAAPVGSSFHQEGLAIDLAAALQNERVFNALRQAGWQQLRGEPWHWTYGTYG